MKLSDNALKVLLQDLESELSQYIRPARSPADSTYGLIDKALLVAGAFAQGTLFGRSRHKNRPFSLACGTAGTPEQSAGLSTPGTTGAADTYTDIPRCGDRSSAMAAKL